MSLFEKYRPREWRDVVGQPKALAAIDRMRKQTGTLGGRAYFIAGPSGTGKTTLARLIAGEVSDPFGIDELDASDLTADYLRTIPAKYAGRPLGGRGWAIIVNEVHGLNRDQTRKLLTATEPEGGLPPWFVWCFTTTDDGADRLFEGFDSAPFASRCTPIPMARRDLAPAFAEHAAKVAEYEELNGQTITAYLRLAKECRNNLREMLSRIEAGAMLAGGAE